MDWSDLGLQVGERPPSGCFSRPTRQFSQSWRRHQVPQVKS